ncbi:MAG: hypothetical protein Q9165_007324 [Trypethelium subeluteriae]
MSTTASYSPPSGSYGQVNLATDFDLTLRIIEYDSATAGPNKLVRSTVDFQVKRDLVSKPAFSKVLANMLNPSGNFAEATQTIVELKDQSCRAIEPFLREVHLKKDHDIKNVDLVMVWLVLHVADFFGFSLEPLRDWFDKCFKSNVFWATSSDYAREIIYPAYMFDHAAAFNTATDFLVYEGEEQLNAAKGRVRTILHDGLFGACQSLLDQSCPCKEKVFFGYFKEMYDLEVLPFETTFKGTSVSDIIWRAKQFKWSPPQGSCSSCRRDYQHLIEAATMKATRYFDGLHSDYWMHNELKGWDKGCRVRHGEPSWYFPFMGRKDEQMKMLKRSSN